MSDTEYSQQRKRFETMYTVEVSCSDPDRKRMVEELR